MQTTETLVPEPSAFEDAFTIEELKRYKSPGIDETQAELVEAGDMAVYSETKI
jgi:hypothetical protein